MRISTSWGATGSVWTRRSCAVISVPCTSPIRPNRSRDNASGSLIGIFRSIATYGPSSLLLAAGVGIVNERAVEDRLDDVAQRVMHHPILSRYGAALMRRGLGS